MQKDSQQEMSDKTAKENKEKDEKSSSGSVFEGLYDRLPDIDRKSTRLNSSH